MCLSAVFFSGFSFFSSSCSNFVHEITVVAVWTFAAFCPGLVSASVSGGVILGFENILVVSED